MALSCPLMITRCAPQEKFPPEPYKKAFIDLASLACFFCFFFRVYGPGRETTKKKDLRYTLFPLMFSSAFPNTYQSNRQLQLTASIGAIFWAANYKQEQEN